MTLIKNTSQSISLFIVMMILITLISACASLIEPKHITIEYDEEVKLHDGEMIWVHITRHYLEGGKEISEMFRGGGKNVIPTYVEISWDTGFEGVGRKSVFFDEQVFAIDFLNNQWYVYGATSIQGVSKETVNCKNVGTLFFNGGNCLLRIDSSGKFLKSDSNNLRKLKKGNILYHYGFEETKNLQNSNLPWGQKLKIQSDKPKKFKLVNKEFNLTGEKL